MKRNIIAHPQKHLTIIPDHSLHHTTLTQKQTLPPCPENDVRYHRITSMSLSCPLLATAKVHPCLGWKQKRKLLDYWDSLSVKTFPLQIDMVHSWRRTNYSQIFRVSTFQEKGHRIIYIITPPWRRTNLLWTITSQHSLRAYFSVQNPKLKASFQQDLPIYIT